MNVVIAAAGVMVLVSGCKTSMRTYVVSGSAMLPLLHAGDRIFVDESDEARSSLHDGDVIVLRHNDIVIVKHILAMPGETISGDHRVILREGKPLNEPYLAPADRDKELAALATFAPRKLDAGEIFVMGDNRDLSADSRLLKYGPVHLSDVVGKYAGTYWHGNDTPE
jgi:signal peptidase I